MKWDFTASINVFVIGTVAETPTTAARVTNDLRNVPHHAVPHVSKIDWTWSFPMYWADQLWFDRWRTAPYVTSTRHERRSENDKWHILLRTQDCSTEA